jgi:hypothetical protein
MQICHAVTSNGTYIAVVVAARIHEPSLINRGKKRWSYPPIVRQRWRTAFYDGTSASIAELRFNFLASARFEYAGRVEACNQFQVKTLLGVTGAK